MEQVNMKTAIKRYNDLMNFIGREHLTLGEALSENTENWNLRDMVSEAQYQLNTYYEDGHSNCLLRDDGPEARREWWIEVKRLRRFIDRFGPLTKGMKVTSKHCSKWDG